MGSETVSLELTQTACEHQAAAALNILQMVQRMFSSRPAAGVLM